MATENRRVDVDRDYFESLYRRHYGAILRFAARRADEQSARDVTAETFLAAWRRLDAVPRDNELGSGCCWLVVIGAARSLGLEGSGRAAIRTLRA
jgi:DNA-directed RNA polymerase specialized sigma24 family protein